MWHNVERLKYCIAKTRLVTMTIKEVRPLRSPLLCKYEYGLDVESPRLRCMCYMVEGAPASGSWEDQEVSLCPFRHSAPGPFIE